jgi:hypothetical protein
MESLSRPVAEARSVAELVEQAGKESCACRRFKESSVGMGQTSSGCSTAFERDIRSAASCWERQAPAGRMDFGPLVVEAPELEDAWWVVDGQQRLTSIIGVLASPSSPGTEFDLYYDLVTGKFRRAGSRRPRADWIPLRQVVDTNEFVNWLIEFREDGASTDQVRAATELGNQLRDYKVPVSLVALRSAIPLLDLGYRVGELVEVGVERAQDAQECVPSHAPMAVLDLRDVGGFHFDLGCELLLRESLVVAHGA